MVDFVLDGNFIANLGMFDSNWDLICLLFFKLFILLLSEPHPSNVEVSCHLVHLDNIPILMHQSRPLLVTLLEQGWSYITQLIIGKTFDDDYLLENIHSAY
jgi:hypothetical protein